MEEDKTLLFLEQMSSWDLTDDRRARWREVLVMWKVKETSRRKVVHLIIQPSRHVSLSSAPESYTGTDSMEVRATSINTTKSTLH